VILDVQECVGWWQWQHWQNAGDGGDSARGDGDDGCHGPTGYGEGVCCCVPTHSPPGA